MLKSYWLYFFPFIFINFFILSQEQTELQTVAHVDLEKYSGKWYEIARLRKPWERACALNTTSTYTLQADGNLHVITQCQSTNTFHPLEKVEGTLQIVNKQTNAKLKIAFSSSSHYQWVYSGDYWIIQLADDYSYAVVSEPTQTHFWILSRTPNLSADLYEDILAKITLQLPNVNILNVMRTAQDQ